ncbi:MAG: hypothetical protein P1V36_05340 [Planctomycetota bacterium]|nr:hypothetical protein [Planctomycetota bacterium]
MTGWIFVALGLLGAALCVYGTVATYQVREDLQASTKTLATEARDLLDAVDRRLVDLPEKVTMLIERREEGAVGERLGQLEGTLGSAHEIAQSTLSLLEVAVSLRGEGRSVEAEFPTAVSLTEALRDLHALIGAQRADLSTWTLRAVVLHQMIESVRSDLAASRAATIRIEERTISQLATAAWLFTLFLLWMGVGQLALTAAGRRAVTGPGPDAAA